MLKILNYKVYDLRESVIASGNAMRTMPMTDYDNEEEFQKGLLRMQRLVKASDEGMVHCHKNALCGIRVSFDIVYANVWTPEAQRYHFFDIVTSASKMHRLCKMDIRKACNEHVDKRSIAILQEKVNNYNYIVDHNIERETFTVYNHDTEEYETITTDNHKDCAYYAFIEMVMNCPMGLELFMRVSTNYLQLATIYWQRKNHRMRDWHIFCRWIETLPYAKELIIGTDKQNKV